LQFGVGRPRGEVQWYVPGDERVLTFEAGDVIQNDGVLESLAPDDPASLFRLLISRFTPAQRGGLRRLRETDGVERAIEEIARLVRGFEITNPTSPSPDGKFSIAMALSRMSRPRVPTASSITFAGCEGRP
jgi:hypothetical protein